MKDRENIVQLIQQCEQQLSSLRSLLRHSIEEINYETFLEAVTADFLKLQEAEKNIDADDYGMYAVIGMYQTLLWAEEMVLNGEISQEDK